MSTNCFEMHPNTMDGWRGDYGNSSAVTRPHPPNLGSRWGQVPEGGPGWVAGPDAPGIIESGRLSTWLLASLTSRCPFCPQAPFLPPTETLRAPCRRCLPSLQLHRAALRRGPAAASSVQPGPQLPLPVPSPLPPPRRHLCPPEGCSDTLSDPSRSNPLAPSSLLRLLCHPAGLALANPFPTLMRKKVLGSGLMMQSLPYSNTDSPDSSLPVSAAPRLRLSRTCQPDPGTLALPLGGPCPDQQVASFRSPVLPTGSGVLRVRAHARLPAVWSPGLPSPCLPPLTQPCSVCGLRLGRLDLC